MVTHEIYQTTDAAGRPVYHLPEDGHAFNIERPPVVGRHLTDLPET
jgi:leucyl-tRNA synthetase